MVFLGRDSRKRIRDLEERSLVVWPVAPTALLVRAYVRDAFLIPGKSYFPLGGPERAQRALSGQEGPLGPPDGKQDLPGMRKASLNLT